MKSVLGIVCLLTLFVTNTADAQCFVRQGFVSNGFVGNGFSQSNIQCVGGRCFVSNGFQRQPVFINQGFNRGFSSFNQPVFVNQGFNRGFSSCRQPVFVNQGFNQPVFINRGFNRGFSRRRSFFGGGFGFGGVRSLSLLGVFGRDAQRFSAFRAGIFGF